MKLTGIEALMFPSSYPIGSIDEQRVRTMAETFKNLGYIKESDNMDLTKFIYKASHNKIFKQTKNIHTCYQREK